MAVNDEIFKNLEVYGGGTINERVYNFLGSLGYTGTINDRLGQFEEGGRKGWQGLVRAWGQWAPAQLFSQGQQGVWYEPKPIVAGQQVLYQDSAGTTPVTADGDPVGLMLDLSRGSVRGPELVSNGDFDQGEADWDIGGAYAITDGQLIADNVSAVLGVDFARSSAVIEEGKAYRISYEISDYQSGSISIVIGNDLQRGPPRDENGLHSEILLSDANGNLGFIRRFNNFTGVIDNISVREIPGNHATQSTSASRPIYRTDGVLHWLAFDGVDDLLKSVFPIALPYSRISALNTQGIGADSYVFSGGTNTASTLYQRQTEDPGTLTAFNGTNGPLGLPPGHPFVASEEYREGVDSLYFNGSLASEVEAGDSAGTGLTIGGERDGTNASLMLFYGVVMAVDIPASQREKAEQYFAGISL